MSIKNIGIIGAGTISAMHLKAYQKNPACRVVGICDIRPDSAKARAQEFNIPQVFSGHKELLACPDIDAVSIVTPTFTHTELILEALACGKDVLCEKPPALTASEVSQCAQAAKAAGRLLMFAFVCRFNPYVQYLKRFVDEGRLGQAVFAEATRLSRCVEFNGWLSNKELCGGFLFDSAIHELDMALYLIGYPRPKTVLGFTSDINRDLPQRIKDGGKYTAKDPHHYERTIESFAHATVTFENGTCLSLQSGSAFNTVKSGICLTLVGEKAGIHLERMNADKPLEILELSEDGHYTTLEPRFPQASSFDAEINHFIDCLSDKEACICKNEQAITLVEILNAIYKSAQLGRAVEL